MTSTLQNRALAKGLAAAVQRNKERTATTITIYHDPRFAIYQIISLIKHALCVLGGMSPSHTSVEIDDGSAELRAALARSETEIQELRQQLRTAMMAQHVAPASEAQRWVSAREAADILGVHKQQIYRAIYDGRITTQSSRCTRKRNHKVDPTTYRQKIREPKSK